MLPELFILCLFKLRVWSQAQSCQHSIWPSNQSPHSTDFYINNKISVLCTFKSSVLDTFKSSVHSTDDLKVSVICDSNIPLAGPVL